MRVSPVSGKCCQSRAWFRICPSFFMRVSPVSGKCCQSRAWFHLCPSCLGINRKMRSRRHQARTKIARALRRKLLPLGLALARHTPLLLDAVQRSSTQFNAVHCAAMQLADARAALPSNHRVFAKRRRQSFVTERSCQNISGV